VNEAVKLLMGMQGVWEDEENEMNINRMNEASGIKGKKQEKGTALVSGRTEYGANMS
jgi:hypothetical protein